MNFQTRIIAQSESLKAKTAQDIISASSLEELILVSIQAHSALKMTALSFDGEERNLVVELFEGDKSVASIDVYGKCLHELYNYQPLPESMHRYCDKPGVLIDEEWFEKRDSRLRFKIDPWEGERLAAPTALAELVLSYAFSSHGMIEMQRKIVEVKPGLRTVIQLKLIFLGSDLEKEEDGWVEVVSIVLDKLETLVRKRKTRVELVQRVSME